MDSPSSALVLTGMILFILANVGFEGGIVFYDAFLPGLTSERSYGRVSGYGFAMGYLGSLTTLLVAMPLYAAGFIPSNLGNVRWSFAIAAGIFLVFSAPLFFFLRDHKKHCEYRPSYIQAGLERVNSTIHHLRNYRQTARFLLAFFIYNDGILTVISFASLYAQQSLSFTLQEIMILFAIVQGSGILGSIFFGIVADKIGPKKTIDINLILWLLVVTAAFFVRSKEAFYVIGALAGSCLGASQSASRSLMALLTPKEREAEFFGFYDGVCGKSSAVIGTFLFGLISYATGNQRISILSVGVFFIVGLVLLQQIDDPFLATKRAGAAS
ncbi:MAG: MFS transporter [Ignavibacteriales bacterium]|nr:MFS transporter [Ignavibacteriales bacterium]